MPVKSNARRSEGARPAAARSTPSADPGAAPAVAAGGARPRPPPSTRSPPRHPPRAGHPAGGGGDQPYRHYARELVNGRLGAGGVGKAHPVHTEDVVAVVRDDPAPPYRAPAELLELAGHERARHRNHFDRQGEAAAHVDQLRVLDDGEKSVRRGGDDLLPGEGCVTALDGVAA